MKYLAAVAILLSAPALAQSPQADTMIVFDGSGSMWGQIDGRTKLEVARETLSSVLEEVPADANIGMIAYGHRQKGVCQDIETLVPVGPATRSVPQMIAAASEISPKGKTPLSDAVRIAADELRYTENAATVVLVTDGIETCDADPCALGRELERLGINFTAHVVGFGLSDDEGRQVQCLADMTGGTYFHAGNAEALTDALRQSVQPAIAPSEADFAPQARDVFFIWRDTDNAPVLNARNVTVLIEGEDGNAITDDVQLLYPSEDTDHSARASLLPGRYTALIQRSGREEAGYQVQFPFEVVEGDGAQEIAGVLGARLVVRPFINPGLPIVKGERIPSGVEGSARYIFGLYPVENGQVVEKPMVKTIGEFDQPVPAGSYILRGELDRFVAAEMPVKVSPGVVTEVDFSFDATRVFVDARDKDGFPVKRQTTYWHDQSPAQKTNWRKGFGVRNGDVLPFYLPKGVWAVNTGGEGKGERRSQVFVEVPGDFADIRLQVGEGGRLSETEIAILERPESRNCIIVKVERNACMLRTDIAMLDVPAPQSEETVIAPVGPQVVGVFTLTAGATLQELLGDPQLVQSCQRAPLVLYPDGHVEVKRFDAPKGPQENPFKTAAMGDCMSQGARVTCAVDGIPALSGFVAKPLGDGHFEFCMDGAVDCDVATSCFYPGGPLNAADIMPNGRPLGELMIERGDGKTPGFGYSDNRMVIQ